MKYIFKYLSVALIFFLLGMLVYRQNWFPRPQIKQVKEYFYPSIEVPVLKTKEIIISQYSFGVPLFSDRNYTNSKDTEVLRNSFVIQIPRHYNQKIKLELLSDVTIFRLLSDDNDNEPFNDWSIMNDEVEVTGQSCIHNKLVSKTFSPGMIELSSGGKISSSPILIKQMGGERNVIPFVIVD